MTEEGRRGGKINKKNRNERTGNTSANRTKRVARIFEQGRLKREDVKTRNRN